MDIGSKRGYPSGALRNFAGHRFVLDGVQCNSMEGFLQSLEFQNPEIQKEVCKLVGLAAKRRGRARTKAWQRVQTLWWMGEAYPRHSTEYQLLLNRAYAAMHEQSASFRAALSAAGDARFTHSIGCGDARSTVLTEAEFVQRLNLLRMVDKQEAAKAARSSYNSSKL